MTDKTLEREADQEVLLSSLDESRNTWLWVFPEGGVTGGFSENEGLVVIALAPLQSPICEVPFSYFSPSTKVSTNEGRICQSHSPLQYSPHQSVQAYE